MDRSAPMSFWVFMRAATGRPLRFPVEQPASPSCRQSCSDDCRIRQRGFDRRDVVHFRSLLPRVATDRLTIGCSRLRAQPARSLYHHGGVRREAAEPKGRSIWPRNDGNLHETSGPVSAVHRCRSKVNGRPPGGCSVGPHLRSSPPTDGTLRQVATSSIPRGFRAADSTAATGSSAVPPPPRDPRECHGTTITHRMRTAQEAR